MRPSTRANSIIVTTAVVVIVVLATAATPDRSEPLMRAEKSVDTGWLRQYDYNEHRDLGRMTREYFQAYSAGTPEQFVRDGLLSRDAPLEPLADVWMHLPLEAESEPFAVDFVARDGHIEASTFTRVRYNNTVDVYILIFSYDSGRWSLDKTVLDLVTNGGGRFDDHVSRRWQLDDEAVFTLSSNSRRQATCGKGLHS